jgi:NMD protein affecting ribosome stability and mRNA decay
MNDMSSQCISCGEEEVFYQHLCRACYLDSNPILKKKLDLEIVACMRCGLIAFKDQWSKLYLNDLETSKIHSKIVNMISKVWKFNYRPKEINVDRLMINFNEEEKIESLIGSIQILASPDPFVPLLDVTEDFITNINWGECSDCRTRLSGVYQSKIQVRSPFEISEDTLEIWGDEIETFSSDFPLSDGKSPLFRLIYIKNGLDALFQAKTAAFSIAKLFSKDKGGIISVTTEFSGFDKSKSKEYPRKQVVLVALPNFQIGDLLIVEKRLLKVVSFSNFKINCLDVLNKSNKRFPIKKFIEMNPEFLESDFEDYQLINFETNENLAQVMNFKTFQNFFVDSEELSNIQEGEIVEGIIYQGKIILKDPSE